MTEVITFEDTRAVPRNGIERSAFRDAGRRIVSAILNSEQFIDDFNATHRAQVAGLVSELGVPHDEPSDEAKARIAAGLVFAEDVDDMRLAVVLDREARAIQHKATLLRSERYER